METMVILMEIVTSMTMVNMVMTPNVLMISDHKDSRIHVMLTKMVITTIFKQHCG